MIDFSAVKAITIPEGKAKAINRESDGLLLWKGGSKNWVAYSTEADGKTIFNGVGYKDNARLNSSAAVVALDGYVTSGYIPAKHGDTVRLKGLTWNSATNTGSYFWTFDSTFTPMKSGRPNNSSQDIVVSEENGVISFYLQNYATGVAYVRLSSYGLGANMVITVNEEIA